MYPEYLNESLKAVERTRAKRLELALTGKPVGGPGAVRPEPADSTGGAQ